MGKYFKFVDGVGTKGSNGDEPDFKNNKEGQNPTIKQHENNTRVSVTIGGFQRPEIPEKVDPFIEGCKMENIKLNLRKNLFIKQINRIKK